MKPVNISQPYRPSGTAGHSYDDWSAMTAIEQAQAHLELMRATAMRWANVQWRPSMGVPAVVVADAQTLLKLCDEALRAIREDDQSALLHTIRATAQAAELNRWTAIDKALSLQDSLSKPRSSGGKATAEKRQRKAQSRGEEIASMYLDMKSKDERDRSGIIARRLGIDRSTVNRHLRKAGIR